MKPEPTKSEQCVLCKHYHLNETCDAFPEGIPAPIRTGAFDHVRPYPGDHNVLYEPLGVEPGPQAG